MNQLDKAKGNFIPMHTIENKGKGKPIPLHKGSKVVSPTHRPPLPLGNIRGTHFC